jgi:hypothetical protein
MKIKLGQAVDIETDPRYVKHVRGYAIGDVYDALVELITNADDSYHDLYRGQKRNKDGGDMLIEHLEQRRGQPSYLVVRDKAEGMDLTEMVNKLQKLGKYSSEAGDRGYMGRGAKDCSELGNVIFESIKENRYCMCTITQNLKFIPNEDRIATHADRGNLGTAHGNGTSVTLQLAGHVRLPHLERLASNLPWHYALRDIMAADADSSVIVRKLGDKRGEAVTLVAPRIEGELVVDEKLEVEGYKSAEARLRIWRAPEPLEETEARFERFGILIKGARAIHEHSLLADEFRKDPHARRYFGRLECPYIDQLLAEYDVRLKSGETQLAENPCLLVDPNRRHGLERRHPFVQKLLQIPIERLRALLARDREDDKKERREIANQETRSRLDRLAKLAGRFLREQLDDLEELGGDDAVDNEAFAKTGVLIWPTYLHVGVGQERPLTIYVRRELLSNEHEPVTVEADCEGALVIVGSPFTLRRHRTKEDRLIGTFKIRGLKVADKVVLTAKCNGLPTARAEAQVVEKAIEEHDFKAPLEFECAEYSVRQGSRKRIRLFAKYPDVVANETSVTVLSADSDKVAIRGNIILTPVAGSNYAEAVAIIEGRTLKSRTTITAEVNGRVATTTVKVIDKPDEKSIPLKFELRDEDFGKFRAMWADHEGKPHLLLISARHKSLSRYLGPEATKFAGQDTPIFRLLLAEIIAESVCRKALTMEAKLHPWEFRWANLQDDVAIAVSVFAAMQQRLREFVTAAHAEMISDQELASSRNGEVGIGSTREG